MGKAIIAGDSDEEEVSTAAKAAFKKKILWGHLKKKSLGVQLEREIVPFEIKPK